MIDIRSLTEDTLIESIDLIQKIFNNSHGDLDHPVKFLPATLKPETGLSRDIHDSTGCIECKYFIALEPLSKMVIGTIGYYTNRNDWKESDWVAWFCVHPEFRRKRIGTKLMHFIKEFSKFRDKKFLRLYTSPEIDNGSAEKFYDKYGFKEYKKEKSLYHEDHEIVVYRELKLKD